MDRQNLSKIWNERWPESRPLAWELNSLHPERWFRVHSLPESQRYAESDEETREVLRRHREVLEALGATLQSPVLSICAQWDSAESPASVLRAELALVQRRAWHWRAVQEGELRSEAGWWHLFVSEGSVAELDGLLRLVSNDECRGVMILPTDLSWIFHPYDGGADIITATPSSCAALRRQFTAWLSSRADGR